MMPRKLFKDLYELYTTQIALIASIPFLLVIVVHHTIAVLIGTILIALKVIHEQKVHDYCDKVLAFICKPLDWLDQLLKI